jgi:Flp pilus assembly pilin Flp
MGRFARSWALVKLCWRVLQQDKELVVFPIVSTIGVLIVTVSFVVPGFFTGFWQDVSDNGVGVSFWVLVVLFYLVEYLVIVFFNAALVSAAIIRLGGGDPTLGDGLRGAWSHIGAILGYAAIAATVGLVLQMLRERAGFAGAIIAALGGMAWTIITFLVVPVLVVEGVGPITAIKRSAGLLKKTWGEQIIGSAGIGLVFGLISLAVAVIGIGLGVLVMSAGIAVLGIAVIAVAVIAIIVISLLGATLRGIYSAALYEYAVGGETGAFDHETLAGAFQPKRSRRGI